MKPRVDPQIDKRRKDHGSVHAMLQKQADSSNAIDPAFTIPDDPKNKPGAPARPRTAYKNY